MVFIKLLKFGYNSWSLLRFVTSRKCKWPNNILLNHKISFVPKLFFTCFHAFINLKFYVVSNIFRCIASNFMNEQMDYTFVESLYIQKCYVTWMLLLIIYILQTHNLGIPIVIIHESKMVDGFYNWICKLGLIVTNFFSFSYKPKLKMQNY